MALVSLFFQKRAQLGQLDIDASLSEGHEASATLTQHELEDGSNANDHIILNPIKLTLEAVVSKTPLGSSALVSSAATAAGGAIGKALGGSNKLLGAAAVVGGASVGGLISNAFGLDGGVDSEKGKSRKPEDVYAYLLELRQKRQPLTVVTALRKYDSMAVTNISVPRSAKSTGHLQFTVTLEQVTIVKASTAKGFAVETSVGGAAQDATKLGKQAATEASAKTSDNATLLFKGARGAGLIPGGG